MNTKLINIQVLALLGDAIYSLYIREKLIKLGYNDIEKIQKKQVEYVSAKGEVKVLNYLTDNNLLTEEGFESLLGDLYLNNTERLYEILNLIEVK